MDWLILFFAGVCECLWAVAAKYSQGFTRWLPVSVVAVAMTASVVLLAVAMKTIPLGTAYAVWTGLGVIGTAVAGIFLFHEPATAMRLISLALIFCGIVGLKCCSSH
ncbi:MAG: multidrug efflux SMR transporter [Victivallaceae bacterium]|nr:multidrug efflux SMR transporter [Victivallaceae bacterium]